MSVEICKLSYIQQIAYQPSLAKESREVSKCIALSEQCYMGFIHGEPACAWGFIPPYVLADYAYLWLHTTPIIQQHQFLFVRHSQRIVEAALREEYPRLVGCCHINDEKAIRWIRWLGGVFGPPEGKRRPFWIERGRS